MSKRLNKEIILLAFSTSSKRLSVALTKGEKVVKEINQSAGLLHSQKLLPAIATILSSLCLSIEDIEAFAIDIGPGSFTGLRIGLATLKGLVFGRKKKVIAVSSLEVLARKTAEHFLSFSLPSCSLFPIIDAKQEKVYTAIYTAKKKENKIVLKRETGYQVLNIRELLRRIKKRKQVVFTGDGIERYQDIILSEKKEIRFAEHRFWFPYASVISEIALKKLKRGEVEDIERLSPMYLIPSPFA